MQISWRRVWDWIINYVIVSETLLSVVAASLLLIAGQKSKIEIEWILSWNYFNLQLSVLAFLIGIYVAIVSISPEGYIRWLIKKGAFGPLEFQMSFTLKTLVIGIILFLISKCFAAVGMIIIGKRIDANILYVLYVLNLAFAVYWGINSIKVLDLLTGFGSRKVQYYTYIESEEKTQISSPDGEAK